MRERIELIVHDPAALTVPLETLQGRWDPTTLDECNGAGGGSFKVRADDVAVTEDPTLLQEGRVVRVKVKGRDVALWEIQKVTDVLIDDGEFAGRWKEFSGAGLLDWLSHAVVLPEAGVAALSDDRNFNYAAKQGSWYVPSQWVDPLANNLVNSKLGPWGSQYPKGWPKGLQANWIWDRVITGTTYPPGGDCYFRITFTTTALQDYRIVATADDYGVIMVNGVKAMTISEFQSEQRTFTVDLTLPAGTHTLAAKVRQKGRADGSGYGPAGLALAMCKVADDTKTENLTNADRILYTQPGPAWRMNAYPAKPPGFTLGGILKTLLDEAKGRGVTRIQQISYGFTETADSYGVPWADTIDPGFAVGMNLQDVVKQITDIYADVWMGPDMVLQMAPKRGVDRSVPVAGADPIAFAQGLNVLDAKTSSTAEIANTVFAKTAQGLSENPGPAASISQFGRRETYLSVVNAQQNGTAPYLIKQVTDKFAMPRRTPTLTIYPDSDTLPYEDFNVGDWVLAPSDTDPAALIKRRVMSISASEEDATGEVTYTCEIDTIQESLEQRLVRWLKQIENSGKSGGASGTSTGASKADIPPVIGGGSGNRPLPVPADLRQPTPPTPPVLTANVVPDDRGVMTGSLLVSWTHDGLATDGSDLPPRTYSVYYRQSGTSNPFRLMTTVAATSVTYQPLPALKQDGTAISYDVYVTASGDTLVPSLPSSTVAVTMSKDTTGPLQPSTPTAIAVRGVFTVFWDGKDFNGAAMVRDTSHVIVEHQNGAAWDNVGRIGGASSATVSGLAYGAHVFRLVPYDFVGNAGTASATATATSTALVGEQEFTDKWNQINGDIATTQSTAAGKNTVSPNAPTVSDLTGKKANSVWTQIVGGKVVGAWYKATDAAPGWTPMPFDPVMIPQVDIGTGTFGLLDGVRMKVNSIGVKSLLVGSLDNVIPDPSFSNAQGDWGGADSTYSFPAAEGYNGTAALKIAPNALQSGKYSAYVPMTGGEDYRVAVWVKSDVAVPANSLGIYLKSQKLGGATVTGNVLKQTTGAAGNDAIAANTWTLLIASGPFDPAAIAGSFGFYKQTTFTTGTVWFSAAVATRMADGELIVDGVVKAKKLDVNDVFADNAVVGKLNAQTGVFLTNSDGTGMTSTVTGQGLRVTYTDPGDGTVTERIKVGTFDDDSIVLSDAAGNPQSTLDNAGGISAKTLSADQALTYQGNELTDVLDARGRGLLAWGSRFTDGQYYAGVTAHPYLSLQFDGMQGGRSYMVSTTPIHCYSDTNTSNIIVKLHQGPGTRAATISDPVIDQGYSIPSSLGGGQRSTVTFNRLLTPSTNDSMSLLLSYSVESAGRGKIMANGYRPVMMTVTDVGLSMPQTGEDRNGTADAAQAGTGGAEVTAPAAVKNYEKNYAHTGVRSYTGSNGTYAYNVGKGYQGLSPAGYGNLKSLFLFNSAQMIADIGSGSVYEVWAYMYFESWYYNAGGTARIGVHGQTSLPGTWGESSTPQATMGMSKGVGKWVRLPSALNAGFKSGAYRGLTLIGDSTYQTYGVATLGQIKLKYTK